MRYALIEQATITEQDGMYLLSMGDQNSSLYFLNETAAYIALSIKSEPKSVMEIVAEMVSDYEVGADECTEDVSKTLEMLSQYNAVDIFDEGEKK